MATPKRQRFTTFVVLTLTLYSLCPAQIVWEKHSTNPVLRGSQYYGIYSDFDEREAISPFVIEENGLFRMWYVGIRGQYSVGEAISMDGVRWYALRGNPRLAPGPPGSFDAAGIMEPTVAKDHDSFKLYFYTTVGSINKIGLAISSDGHTWVKHSGNPLLEPGPSGSWDDEGVWAPMVLYENNIYKMWYQGFDGVFSSVGYATSSDGIHWTKHPNNPVLPHGRSQDFDYYTAGQPFVVRARGQYHMFYTGTDAAILNNIGYAVSHDGTRWAKYVENPVVGPGPTHWDIKSTAAASVIFKDHRFTMWYVGWNGVRAIGYATSESQPPELLQFHEELTEYKLHQSYPNPFNPTTTITYDIPKESHVTITVYNTLGQEVARLVDEQKSAGYYQVVWHTDKMPSGTYWYRMTAGDFVEARNLLLVK